MKERPKRKATSTNSKKKVPRTKHSGSNQTNNEVGVRLQKFLAAAGLASRRAAEELIRKGRVRVNGKVVTVLGTRVDPKKDKVEVAGEVLETEEKVLYMFNKPRQVVSTLSDPHGRKCLAPFVSALKTRVYPVGRLDYDVGGLLLLTNDGDFTERMLHPRHEEDRVYIAQVRGLVNRSVLSELKKGVRLEDGEAKAADVKLLTATPEIEQLLGVTHEKERFSLLELTVREGRNHFVKRICEAVNHPVTRMTRVRFGKFELGNLGSGKMKRISLRAA